MKPGPRPQSVERWLRRVIKDGAVKVRCATDEGDKTLKVESKNSKPRVLHLLRTLEALAPTKLEALNADGDVLDVWEVPEEDVAVPGYTKEDDDTKDERMLKTFAHLLADAHRQATKQLVEVVSIQSSAFGEERKHTSIAMAATERIVRRLQNGASRIRVATEEGEEGGDENFMAQLLGPLLQNAVREEVSRNVPAAAPAAANGAGAKEAD